MYTSSSFEFESPLVSSDVIFSPYKPITYNFDYSRPLISTYETIDDDVNMRDKMVDYFYDLVRDKWLLDDINDILNYYKYDDKTVHMISSLSEYNKHNISKDTDKSAQEKVKYITKTIFDRYNMRSVLSKFTKGTNTKWVNLPKNEYYVMKFTQEYIMKLINKQLKKK
jgi:hypothetical protein